MKLQLAGNKSSYLLAVSGGVDSMVMCQLFYENQLSFSVAHCNFQLRGDDSNQDEELVKNWCINNNIPFYTTRFNTTDYAEKNKVSIQVAARQLRYEFFYEILKTQQIDFIATAHHMDDSVETTLFHFFRGTGINGLTGISFQNDRIIRPLLSYTKQSILEYAATHSIEFREDASNAKKDYTRNKLRNDIIPQLEIMIPNFKENIYQNILRFNEINEVYSKQINLYKRKLLEQRGQDYYIPILKLKHVKPLSTVLYELLKKFGFSYQQCLQCIDIMDSQTGSLVKCEQYQVIKNRNFLIITKINSSDNDFYEISHVTTELVTQDFKLKFNSMLNDNFIPSKEATQCTIDASKLEFPLILRKWKQGDYMYPFGMTKKKKVARVLIDIKLPLHEKEHVWVIESNKKIVWIVGIKTDNRFRIHSNSKELFTIKLNK